MVKVGIIANPISARDIRRVISHAGNLPINDRANIVLRMMAGLAAAGVQEVVVMPENGGIRFHLERSIRREARLGHANFPQLRYLNMPVTATPEDSARAARMMAAEGVAAIVVLGGDGTNRVVVSACGKVPVAGVSTGTNNAFPELREPTITGLEMKSVTQPRRRIPKRASQTPAASATPAVRAAARTGSWTPGIPAITAPDIRATVDVGPTET